METVAATQTRLESFIKDYCAQPEINLLVDLSPGSVLSELLIKLSAQLHNQLRTDAEVPSTINTVQTALNSTTDTYSEAIDAVASNFNVARNTGVTVTGRVKVTVAFDRTYYIGANFQLIHTNLNAVYRTTRTYRVAKELADNATNGELELYRSSDGTFYFLLPVEGVDTTITVAAPHNSSLILNSANTTLEGFVEAKAFGNFSSGRPVETDRALIARFQSGLSSKGLVSPQSMQVLLPEVFPELFTQGGTGKAVLSVVGASDPELNRGKNTSFGLTPFGLADVYVRTSDAVQTDSFPVTAVCTHVKAGSVPAEWTIVLDSTVPNFPTWFYSVVSISYTDDTGITQTTYPKGTPYHTNPVVFTAAANPANRLDGGTVPPAAVARFTRYQVCTLRAELSGAFADDPLIDSVHDVQVMVTYMPSIGDIQDYMLQNANRVVAADYLVKAVIPCNLSTSITIKKGSSAVLNGQDIKRDIFNYVNSLSFGDSVAVSKFVDICHNYDIKRVDLPVLLSGNILVPSTTVGQTLPLTSTDLLTLPYDPNLIPYGVSSRTTMFFINYQDITGRDSIGLSIS